MVIVHIRGLCIGCGVGGVTSGTTAGVSKFFPRWRNSLTFAVYDNSITFFVGKLTHMCSKKRRRDHPVLGS